MKKNNKSAAPETKDSKKQNGKPDPNPSKKVNNENAKAALFSLDVASPAKKTTQDRVNVVQHLQDKYFKEKIEQLPDQSVFKDTKEFIEGQNLKYYEYLLKADLNLEGFMYKKTNIVDDSIVGKKLKDAQLNKEQLEKQLKNMDNYIGELKDQNIINHKTAFSHPSLRQYYYEEDKKLKKEARQVIKKIKIESKQQHEDLQKKEKELLVKRQEQKEKEEKAKIQKEETEKKQKVEEQKKKIEQIKDRKEQRAKEIVQKEENYQKQREKFDQRKIPLYREMERKFQVKEKKKEQQTDEKIKNHHNEIEDYDFIKRKNLEEREKKYEEERKLKLEEKKLIREEKQKKLFEKFPSPKVENKKYLVQELKESQDFEALKNQRAQEIQKAKARHDFSVDLLKKNQELLQKSDRKALEMQIRLDKLNNPRKYIHPLGHKELKPISDQSIFLNQAPLTVGESGKSRDFGKNYLKNLQEINEVIKSKRGARSEKRLNSPPKINDTSSSFLPPINQKTSSTTKNSDAFKKSDLSKKSDKFIKYDYMNDVRTKYSLDAKVNNWKRYLPQDSQQQINYHQTVDVSNNNSNVHSSYHLTIQNKQNIFREAEKLQYQAQRKEEVLKYKDKHQFTTKDADQLEEVDNMYFDSIKAKLAILDGVTIQEENQSQLNNASKVSNMSKKNKKSQKNKLNNNNNKYKQSNLSQLNGINQDESLVEEYYKEKQSNNLKNEVPTKSSNDYNNSDNNNNNGYDEQQYNNDSHDNDQEY